MERNQERGGVKRFIGSRIFLIALVLFAGVLLFMYSREYYQDYKIRREIESLRESVSGLEQKKLESMEILAYVMSKNFVEEQARTQLNMKKPGEEVAIIQIPDGPVAKSAPPRRGEESALRQQPLKNPIKWWYYFIHHRLPEEAE